MQTFEIEQSHHVTKVSFMESPIKKVIVTVRKGFDYLAAFVMKLVSAIRKSGLHIEAFLEKTVSQIRNAPKSIRTFFIRLAFPFKRIVILETDVDLRTSRKLSETTESLIEREYFVVTPRTLEKIQGTKSKQYNPGTVLHAGPHLASTSAAAQISKTTNHYKDAFGL